MTDTTDVIRCPHCQSFAWYVESNAIVTGENGGLLDMSMHRCEDCNHVWVTATPAPSADTGGDDADSR